MADATEIITLMHDTYDYPKTGYFPEYLVDWCLNGNGNVIITENVIDNAIGLITNLNQTYPYKHDGYQYEDAIISSILSAWLEVANILGIPECYWENGKIIFNGSTGKATFDYSVAIDSQWGNEAPKNYKIYIGEKKIKSVYVGEKKISKIYKGEKRIF